MKRHFRVSILRWIITRAAFLYLIVFLVQLIIVDNNKISLGKKIREGHFLKPDSFRYLVDLNIGRAVFHKTQIEVYDFYYQKVIEYLPQQEGGYSMAGFCAYYLEDYNRAIVLYEEAIKKNLHTFWPYYNLGVVYSKIGYMSKAEEFWKKALVLNPDETVLNYKNSAVIYGPILNEAQISEKNIVLRIQKGKEVLKQIMDEKNQTAIPTLKPIIF